MDTLIDSLIQLLIDWGYVGMFLSAILAGSILPFSSELVMIALIKLGLSPLGCLFAATVGNTVGGMTCYYMGHLGRLDWVEHYLKIKRDKVERAQRFLQGKGAMMAFFAFLPFVGGLIAVTLGLMRSNLPLTVSSMLVGKLLRYILLLWALQETLSMIPA